MKVFFNEDTLPLLYFLFPGYKKIESVEWNGAMGKVLYFLQKSDRIPDIDRMMQNRFTDYLIVTMNDSHVIDRKFSEEKDIVQYVAEVKRLKLTKIVEKYTCPEDSKKKVLTAYEFLQFIKMTMVLGRWYTELFEKQERVYQLFDALRKSKESFVEEYFLLRKRMLAGEIFSSVLTFLYRFKSKDSRRGSKLSNYYLELLASLENVVKPESIPVSLLEVVRIKNEVPIDSRVIYFLLTLRK